MPTLKTMTIRRAIFWGVFFAVAPAVAYTSFDIVHVQEEFESFTTGVVPDTWWRESRPLAELDERLGKDPHWKTLRTQITDGDKVRMFRSPNRAWSGYEYTQGLLLVRQGRVLRQAILSRDGLRITRLIPDQVPSPAPDTP